MSVPNTHIDNQTIRKAMQNALGKNIHFIGVGGIMMSSLALLTERLGYRVSGSDRSRSSLTERLMEEGIDVKFSHGEENISNDCAVVVYTVAISDDNPEYVKARSLGIPCISRANYLGYVMTGYKNRIGIAGMHGKSSCTSMCAEIFMRYGQATKNMPTIISGAEYATINGAYYIGEKENFIFEACEYMDSFLDFFPTVAVLLNADLEHVDYFKNIEQIIGSFAKYASLTGDDGVAVACADDENIMRAVESYSGKLITFGICENADYVAKNICHTLRTQEFDIYEHGNFAVHISLPSFGIHNVRNALASFVASHVCGVPVDIIADGLAHFKGAKRRMEYKGIVNGAYVYDDYGHHPTEIRATLSGAKDFCHGRLICAFQPHTYSRTATLINDFADAFELADAVIFADIYAARESDNLGISSEIVARRLGGKGIYAGSACAVADEINKIATSGDTVIVMGAGDIYKVFDQLNLK